MQDDLMLVRNCQRYKFSLLREAEKDKDRTKQGKKQLKVLKVPYQPKEYPQMR